MTHLCKTQTSMATVLFKSNHGISGGIHRVLGRSNIRTH